MYLFGGYRWRCQCEAVLVLLSSLPPQPTVRRHNLHINSSIIGHIHWIPDMIYSTSSSSFQSLFIAALQDYGNQTGTKLDEHPIAKQLEKCETVDSITSVLQEQAREFREFRGEDGKVMKSLKSAIHVLYTLSTSTALGEGIGLVR